MSRPMQWIENALVGLLVSFVWATPAVAQTSGRPDGLRFVPDVPNQYRDLTEYAEPLGFHIGGSPNPSACRHYQAITRVDSADGTPFFLVTRSGNTPETPGGNELNCDDSPNETRNGHLIVFRMGSRERHGERLRSNRLRRGVHVDATPPPLEDKASIYFTVVGGDPSHPDPAQRPGLVFRDGEGTPPERVYQHPGGMQLVGHMLAIALEAPRDATLPRTQIMFFDVSNPENPVFKSQYTPINGAGEVRASAGVVAVTPLPGGRYLMMTTGAQNTTWYFYRSTLTDLSSEELSWDYIGSIPAPPGLSDPHQTLQFLREPDMNAAPYLAGARGHPVHGDRDRLDLFRVECETPECTPGEQIHLTIVYRGRRISPFPSTGGTRLANLAAASGFHVTPSGELIFYATEHENDGPSRTVKAGEWRHINVVRPGSPTLRPTVVVDGPHLIDEGQSVSLRGVVKPPSTSAWIQLFHQPHLGGVDFASLYPVVDYRDRHLDDFDDFHSLEFLPRPAGPLTHNDKARSWNWFAPVGCSIRAIDHHEGQVDETKTLEGTGSLRGDGDLALVLNDGGTDDVDREIDAVEFLPDCDEYYSRPFELWWDLDVNGSYETTGTLAFFSAAHRDGPSEIHVPALARHPAGSPTAQTTATITVRNVKPRLTQFRVLGGGGQQLNAHQILGHEPSVLMGLPVTIEADFTDPGVLDRQTATINWGDASVEPQTAFRTFKDAFAGATGTLSHTHRYTVAGSRLIVLSVRDDDGGLVTKATTVRVISPEQAVEMVVAQLDVVIAATSDENARQNLEQARRALVGSDPRIRGGALQMIRAGDNQAAIDLIGQAIASLQAVGDAAAARLIPALEQVVAALSALSRL